ncbi:MAG: outer membrane protein assembly factor BamA [Deltaproteobacteria bacterium]|nr:outer membrane protein assembly factor BamA [Deltaproteobacteria bacterium]
MRAARCAERFQDRLALSLGLFATVFAIAAAATAVEPGHTVVVLPFRVHSAKPVDYLGESISNLIRSRLEARGEVSLIDVALPDGAIQQASDSDLRELATEAGADTVVSGSLTELAGHFSLDVRVTPAAIGLRSHTFVLTARRDNELLARVNELADQVLNQIVGEEPANVAEVQIIGPPDAMEIFAPQLQTQSGMGYDPAAIRDDLTLLRAMPDVADAQVETERGPEGVVVRFNIVMAERILPAPTSQQASGEQVAEIRVRGNRRIEADAIKARIMTEVGSRYSPTQIAKDLTAVHSLGFFSDVRIFRESGPSGLIVVFEVEEYPVVRQISISGNDNLDSDDIRDILTLTTGSALDYPLLFENRSRIEGLYRAQGFYLAEVSYEIAELGEASISVDFVVVENEKLKLREIRFEGNEVFTDSQLKEGFKTKVWRFWSLATSWFDRSGTFSEPLFVQDLRLVEEMYRENGFIQVEVGYPDVEPIETGLIVTVQIAEGDQFRVGGIDIDGDSTVDLEGLRAQLSLQQGDIFNRTFLTQDVEGLQRHYTDRGFFLAEITPLTDLSQEELTIDVVFQVERGPLYFIREVGISGNTRTVDAAVRREVPIVEGQLYSSRAIEIARVRLQRLSFFEEVELRPEPTDDPQLIDLEVEVVERPTGSFSFGAGFSSQDSFVLTGSLSESNLFGRGYGLNLTADLSFKSQRIYAQFSDPYFLGSDFSMSGTVFRTSIRFEDFEQEQTGGEIIFGHSLTEDNRARAFARYSIRSRKIDQNSNVNAAAIIFREILGGSELTSSAGINLVADTRNNRLSPTSGYEVNGALEFAGLGGFTRFLRVEARGIYYMPAPSWLLERSAFSFRTSVGYVLSLNDLDDFDWEIPTGYTSWNGNDQIRSLDEIDTDSTLPLSERYFLGGLGQFQLRGFKARSIGPRRPILRKIFPDDPDGELNGGPLFTPTCAKNGPCNDIDAEDTDDFADLERSDVIGGNKFISSSIEYRFPISDAIGLEGILFLDAGNAFSEGDNMLDLSEWRWGSGAGVLWFSPFGPLAVVLGFPLDPTSQDKSPVFEFSVGGQGL